MKLEHHPTVMAFRAKQATATEFPQMIESAWLKKEALALGADDVGIVDLERASMADYRQDLLGVLPDVRAILVMAFNLNHTALQSTAHSIADLEFKHAWTRGNQVGRKMVDRLQHQGVKALNMPAGFPYETQNWPGKMWLTSDKIFALEGGLGHMGWSRLILHKNYGASIVLGCVLLDRPCDQYDQPLDFNPCLECGLCLKVCPVGAVKRTDAFDFMACYSHNYRERLGGFLHWIEQITDSKNHAAYRRKVKDHETISMWQNLAIGAQTRCDRCMAVCPAGEATIGKFLDNHKQYLARTLRPFQSLAETIYVVKGSDAAHHVQKNFPHKSIKYISNGIRPTSAKEFLESLPLAFQPGQSEKLDAVYHFAFTGAENLKGTVTIRHKKLEVADGHTGRADLHVTSDSKTWIKFLAKEINLVRALATRKIKIKGSPKLLMAFAKCFPA
jgi:epoxyqueuosine reductase QueG